MECEVCGKTKINSYYKLCIDCFKEKENGNIVICEFCGKFHKIEIPCKCGRTGTKKILCKRCGNEIKTGYFCETCKDYYEFNGNKFCEICKDYHIPNWDCKTKQFKNIDAAPLCSYNEDKNNSDSVINKQEGIECVTGCGNTANNGYYFCTECWKKYRNKDTYVKFSKCQNPVSLGEEYPSINQCDDGHKVKSEGEIKIDNALYALGIAHAYEKELELSDGTVVHPDFYVDLYTTKAKEHKHHIYIEYWGIDNNESYEETRAYKDAQYRKLLEEGEDCTFIYIEKNDIKAGLNTIKTILRDALTKAKEHRINDISGNPVH